MACSVLSPPTAGRLLQLDTNELNADYVALIGAILLLGGLDKKRTADNFADLVAPDT
jgi:hypothetical protein